MGYIKADQSQEGRGTACSGSILDMEISSGGIKFSEDSPFQTNPYSDHRFLLGGIPTPLKNDGVRQWEGLSHVLRKIKFMFQTTKQSLLTNHH